MEQRIIVRADDSVEVREVGPVGPEGPPGGGDGVPGDNVAVLVGGNTFAGLQTFQAPPLVPLSFEDIFNPFEGTVGDGEWTIIAQQTDADGRPRNAILGAKIDFSTFPDFGDSNLPSGTIETYAYAEWGLDFNDPDAEPTIVITQLNAGALDAGAQANYPDAPPFIARHIRYVVPDLKAGRLITAGDPLTNSPYRTTVPEPIFPEDAASKAYVDQQVGTPPDLSNKEDTGVAAMLVGGLRGANPEDQQPGMDTLYNVAERVIAAEADIVALQSGMADDGQPGWFSTGITGVHGYLTNGRMYLNLNRIIVGPPSTTGSSVPLNNLAVAETIPNDHVWFPVTTHQNGVIAQGLLLIEGTTGQASLASEGLLNWSDTGTIKIFGGDVSYRVARP